MKTLAQWLLTFESFRCALIDLGWAPVPVETAGPPSSDGGGGPGEPDDGP